MERAAVTDEVHSNSRSRSGHNNAMFRIPARSISLDVDLPASALDVVETALDFGAVHSALSPLEKKEVSSLVKSQYAHLLYGRGPSSLAYSHSKRLTLALAVAMLLYVALSVEFICYFRGFCFADEPTGNGDGTGGARKTFAPDAARAVVPAAIVLAVMVAPSAMIAAYTQIMATAILSFFLNAVSCALLIVAGIGELSLLPGMSARAAKVWATLPLQVRLSTYDNAVVNLETEMHGDATAVGLAALAGAVITGLAALFLFPLASTQLAGFLAGRGKIPMGRLCCSVTPFSHVHDAAYDQVDTGKYVVDGCIGVAHRMCPACAHGMLHRPGVSQAEQHRGSGACAYFGACGLCAICNMTTREASTRVWAAVYRWTGWYPPGTTVARQQLTTAAQQQHQQQQQQQQAGITGAPQWQSSSQPAGQPWGSVPAGPAASNAGATPAVAAASVPSAAATNGNISAAAAPSESKLGV